MRKLVVFNQISLDGYFTDAHGDMSWAHKQDPEWKRWVAGNAKGGGALVFGRITYQMMASWWPTPMARKADPVVARKMNELPKYVFSRSLKAATWQNTTLLKGELAAAMRKLKTTKGPDLVIMGSGTIVSQLTDAGLIDEYQLVINPIVLGGGRTLFEGVEKRVSLKRKSARTFRNGNVVVTYEPA